MQKYDNSINEQKIGESFGLIMYIRYILLYGIIGAVVGYAIGRNYLYGILGAVLFVALRILFVKIKWKVIRWFVDLGNK